MLSKEINSHWYLTYQDFDTAILSNVREFDMSLLCLTLNTVFLIPG